MNVSDKIANVITELYRTPTFKVEMEGIESAWTEQITGIRQGCPLSPYLFIIIMSCLFHDIHKYDRLKLGEQRMEGMEHDEVLYADDTICMTQDEEAMNRILSAIETEGAKYGLKLNRTKCEYLHFGNATPVNFKDGTPVPQKAEVKYLGCNINDKGDPAREVSRRIRECMATLNKLHPFFYHTDNSVSRKLQMFNSVISSKLMYGMETIEMNLSLKQKLDTFQLKCLRQIMHLPTTYINREFSNDYVKHPLNIKNET